LAESQRAPEAGPAPSGPASTSDADIRVFSDAENSPPVDLAPTGLPVGPPDDNDRAGSSDETVTITRAELDRIDHAGYMRGYRAKKKGAEAPAARTPAPSTPTDATAPPATPAPPTDDQIQIELAHRFVTAFLLLGTDWIHRQKLDAQDPRFGETRAKTSADAIAPYLGPLLTHDDWRRLVMLLVAAGVPSWQILDWSYEVRRARAIRGDLPEPESPTETPEAFQPEIVQ